MEKSISTQGNIFGKRWSSPTSSSSEKRLLAATRPLDTEKKRNDAKKFAASKDDFDNNPNRRMNLSYIGPSLKASYNPNPAKAVPPSIHPLLKRTIVKKRINPWDNLIDRSKTTESVHGLAVNQIISLIDWKTELCEPEPIPSNPCWAATNALQRDITAKQSLKVFEENFYPPNYKRNSSIAFSLDKKRADEKAYFVRKLTEIWTIMKDDSSVFQQLNNTANNSEINFLNGKLEVFLHNHIGAKNRFGTLRGDYHQLNRFTKFLVSMGKEPNYWSFDTVYALFHHDQQQFLKSNSMRPTSFKNLLRVLKKYKEIWGLGSFLDDNQTVILERMANAWQNDHMQLLKKAVPVSCNLLLAIEDLLVNATVILSQRNQFFDDPNIQINEADVDSSPQYVSLSTYLWAFTLRLFCGAGIRWGDGLFTKPPNVKLYAEGLVANGEIAKNRNKSQGRPWASSAAPFSIKTRDWLS